MLSDLIQRSEAFRTERRKAEQEANRKRATAATGHEFRGNQYKSTEVVGPQIEVQPPADKPQTKPKRDIAKKHEKAASTALAAQVGVNRAAVERADFIRKNSLELAKKVIDGEVPASAAVREIRREQKRKPLRPQGYSMSSLLIHRGPWKRSREDDSSRQVRKSLREAGLAVVFGVGVGSLVHKIE